jgi:hypothetical protein
MFFRKKLARAKLSDATLAVLRSFGSTAQRQNLGSTVIARVGLRLKSARLLNNFAAFLAIGICFVFVFASSAHAQTPTKSGSSSRSYRTDAIRSIPFRQINQLAGRRIQSVVKNPSFYRRLPVESISSDPDFFRFLVRKPEVIVSIWQLMGVTQMTAERTAPYAVATNDGAGTISELELIYGNDNLHVFYGTGSYTGSLIKQKLTGRCVIVLRTRSNETSLGSSLNNQLDIFLKVDNAAAALVTRTIQPLVGTTADHNFVESLKFVERLSDSTKSNGPGVKEMGKRLKIDDAVRQEFFAVVDQVFDREYRRKFGSKPAQAQVSLPKKPPANLTNRGLASPKQPLIRPGAGVQKRITVDNPAAHFVPKKQSLAKAFQPDSNVEGVSVLVGGPRPRLSSTNSLAAGNHSTMSRSSGPIARSAMELPPIVTPPNVDSNFFKQAGPGRFIPVHKVPR